MRYFHGGVPGLRPGDLANPHPPRVLDGCPVCAARAQGLTATLYGHPVDPPTRRPDRGYITTDREYARFYASLCWYGDLYTVDPVNEFTADLGENGYAAIRGLLTRAAAGASAAPRPRKPT